MDDLQITSTDSENGKVLIRLKSQDGTEFRMALDSMNVASLVTSLLLSLEDALGQPAAESASIPLHHVQYEERAETVFFRVFVTDRVFHEYTTPANTTLSVALKAFADQFESASMALAMRQAPGQTKN